MPYVPSSDRCLLHAHLPYQWKLVVGLSDRHGVVEQKDALSLSRQVAALCSVRQAQASTHPRKYLGGAYRAFGHQLRHAVTPDDLESRNEDLLSSTLLKEESDMARP